MITYGLRSMIRVHVLVLEILVRVAHILRSVNLVELSLAVSDLKWVSSAVAVVLSQVRANQWSISLCVEPVECLFEGVGDCEEGDASPSGGHGSEVRHAEHRLCAQVEAGEHGETTGTVVRMVEPSEVLPILELHVVGEQVLHAVVVLIDVVPLEAIILGSGVPPPGSARHLRHTAEVAHGRHFVQHVCSLI